MFSKSDLFAVACLCGVLVASYFIATRRLKSDSHKHVYLDEDGEASTDVPQGMPDRILKISVSFLAFATLCISALNWVLIGYNTRCGIITSGWIIISIDTTFLLFQPLCRQCYRIGLLVAISSLVLSSALVVGNHSKFSSHINYWLQLACGICLAILSCSLQRRPPVFFEGREVDGQLTCSAIGKFTFAWVGPLLNLARNSRSIEFNDLAVLGNAARSRNLNAHFPSRKTAKQPLWRIIVRNHWAAICQQWLIASFESVVSMLPPICMYKILSLLEKRTAGQLHDNSTIWFWVICLAGSKATEVGLNNWLQWVSFAIFANPVRSQLSAVIFAKSLRMKLVQEATSGNRKVSPDSNSDDEGATETDALLPSEETVEQEQASAEDETEQSATKGIVNLLGVDVQRISIFCGYNIDLLRGVVKVTLAALLLGMIIGWPSTLAGFAVPVIMQPLNAIATKRYTSTQFEVMEARDNKAHVVTEALHGIRQIKFSASEEQWEKRIMTARKRELQAQWNVYVWALFLTSAWITMPALIGAVALSVYAWTSKEMVPSVAFTALSIFSSLEFAISALPTTITEMLDAQVSADRVQAHLNAEERVETPKTGAIVELKDAEVAWPSTSQGPRNFTLRALNFKCPSNELSVVHGKTGTGKSLLLAAIIGEADVIAGEIVIPQAPPMDKRNNETASTNDWIIPTAIAYVAQVPWIENSSVKDTILYGLPYRHDRYMKVIHACALVDDIEMLPDGENTEIGATGINLSGGQRWRLTFARALYSRAGILILDDIFSAVDSHVGRHLLDHGILGPLGANRTKILVTHHIGLVQRYAACVVTLNGHGTASIEHNPEREGSGSLTETASQVEVSEATAISDSPTVDDPAKKPPKAEAKKFVEDEERQQGRVKWSVYTTYLRASGGMGYWLLTLLLFSLAAFSIVARSYWLTLWTKTYTAIHGPSTDHNKQDGPYFSPQPNLVFYLGVYIAISLISIGLVAVKVIMVYLASLRAARHLFELVTTNVLRAQLRWLDTQPIGRILNRFVGDFAQIDSRLGGNISWCANGLFQIMTIIAAAMFVSPWMLLPVLILSLLCFSVVYLYMDAARDVKRLESNAKSPMFELVGSTISGLDTIRSFGRVEDYLIRMYSHIDRYAESSWYILLATHWMRFRQGLLGVFFTMCIAIGVIYSPTVDASLAGFALSFSLDFSAVIEDTINRYTSTELAMNSTERVLEYTHLDTETSSGVVAKPSWPSNGKIIVKDLEVAYAKHLSPVLKGISLSIQPCQRVGIVGRTGSGKSSFTLALFRFLEARRGSIEIDDVDIATLKLHDVRSRLAIIPQDPVLFSGTLRSNMDPFDEYTDEVLLGALRRVTPASDLSTTTSGRPSIFTNLSSPIVRGGSNLSQGEKQLVCLARAIITRPKIMVLDEATSAVDMATDTLIQRSIREEFRNSTLLVVAHRLSTVADFDRILVMKDGNIEEYDEPKVLAQKKGLFWSMLNDSGEKEALEHLLI